MNITDVTTSDWQTSSTGFGEIAQGAADINQCFNNILTTQKGSDPLRYDFGLDLLKYIDKPVNIMAPALVQEIITQIAAYETRVDLRTVNYSTPVTGKTLFALTWVYKPGTILSNNAINSDAGGTTYFLLSDNNGFILVTDLDVSIMIG